MGQTNSKSRQTYEFGSFRLVPAERLLLRDDQPVALTAKAFDLLVTLVENSGHLVEKADLMNRLWPDTFVEEANLSVTMSALRRALGENPADDSFIQTVPRHGYRFVGRVEEHGEATTAAAKSPDGSFVATGEDTDNAGGEDAGLDEEHPPIASPRPAPAPRQSLPLMRGSFVFFGLILLVAALTGLFSDRFRAGHIVNSVPLTRIQSLAVLPLTNDSRDTSPEYFADGLTDALITDLAQTGVVRVLSRSAVMPYKGTARSLPEIARALNVDAVLTGTVARSGDTVRIAVFLRDAETDQNRWADRYERDVSDVLTLRRKITQDIVGEIKTHSLPKEQIQFGRVGPVNPQAYDHYLRGQYYLLRQNKQDNESAIRFLEQAVTADPLFAEAHAELAQAYVWKLFLFAPNEKKWAEKAFVAAEKALALNPESAVAHLARGRLLWTPANHFPHEKAIREYRRALALNPNLDEARNQLALVYSHIGAFDHALEESREAILINPTNNLAQYRIAQTLNFQGKYRDALSVLRAIPPEVNPSLVGHQKAWALFNLGRREEASAMLAQLLRDTPEDSGGLFTSIQAVLAASAGQDRLAEEKIRLAVQKGEGFGHFHHTAYHIGCAYALLNKPDQAIRWLEAAAEDGFPCYSLFKRDKNLDNLRQDARFVSLLTNLDQQWQQYRTVLSERRVFRAE